MLLGANVVVGGSPEPAKRRRQQNLTVSIIKETGESHRETIEESERERERERERARVCVKREDASGALSSCPLLEYPTSVLSSTAMLHRLK